MSVTQTMWSFIFGIYKVMLIQITLNNNNNSDVHLVLDILYMSKYTRSLFVCRDDQFWLTDSVYISGV